MDKVAEYDKPKYSLKDLYWFGARIAIATFIVSGIYFQFQQMRRIQEIEHIEVKESVEKVNGRIDRKHNAQQEFFNEKIEAIWVEFENKQDKKQ